MNVYLFDLFWTFARMFYYSQQSMGLVTIRMTCFVHMNGIAHFKTKEDLYILSMRSNKSEMKVELLYIKQDRKKF